MPQRRSAPLLDGDKRPPRERKVVLRRRAASPHRRVTASSAFFGEECYQKNAEMYKNGKSAGLHCVVSNVNGLIRNASLICDTAPTGLHFLSEMHMSPNNYRKCATAIESCGVNKRLLTTPPIQGVDNNTRVGVGLVYDDRKFLVRELHEEADVGNRCRRYIQRGRLAIFVVTTHKTKIVFFLVYGEPEVGADGILQAIQERAVLWGQRRPMFILGDMNITVQRSQWVQAQALNGGGQFVDVCQQFGNRDPTFFRGEATATRIDWLFANQTALAYVGRCWLSKDFVDHASIHFVLDIPQQAQYNPQRMKPRALPPKTKKPRELKVGDLIQITAIRSNEWKRAMDDLHRETSKEAKRAAIDIMVDIWAQRAERLSYAQSDEKWSPALHQRGKEQPIRQVPRTFEQYRHADKNLEAARAQVKVRQLNKAISILRAIGSKDPSPRVVATWRKFCKYMRNALREWNQQWPPPRGLPPPEDRREYQEWLEKEAHTMIRRANQEVIAVWKERMFTTKVFQYIKKPTPPVLPFAEIPGQADVCTDPGQIDAATRKLWGQIWARNNDASPNIERMVAEGVPQQQQQQFAEITAEELLETRDFIKKDACEGPDGWRPSEVWVALENPQRMEELRAIYNGMNRYAVTPTAWGAVDTVLLPKSTSLQFDKMRPISISSALWRLFSSIQMRKRLWPLMDNVLGALDLDKYVKGCREGKSARELTIPAAIQKEANDKNGASTWAILYDIKKAFDQLGMEREEHSQGQILPEGLVWALLKRMGVESALILTLQDFYGNLRRRFRRGRYLGEAMNPVGLRGALQGCALSMCIETLVTVFWLQMQKHGVPVQTLQQARDEVLARRICTQDQFPEFKRVCSQRQHTSTRMGTYMDDLHVIAALLMEAVRANWLSQLWVTGIRQQFQPDKTMAYGPRDEQGRLCVAQQPIPMAKMARFLGDEIGDGNPAKTERLSDLKDRCRRIQYLPGGAERRASLIASAGIPCLYGGIISNLTQDQVIQLQSKIYEAIRGNKDGKYVQSLREHSTVNITFYKGHKTDPVIAIPYQAILDFVRSDFDEKTRTAIQQIYDDLQLEAPDGPGQFLRRFFRKQHPVVKFYNLTNDIGIRWEDPFRMAVPRSNEPAVQYELPITDKSKRATFAHQLRELLREELLQNARTTERLGKRKIRRDFEGIEGEKADWEAMRAGKGELTTLEFGYLRMILYGAFFARDRLFRHLTGDAWRKVASPYCTRPCCLRLQRKETTTHVFWECEYWQEYRSTWMRQQQTQSIPICTREVGIILKSQNIPVQEFYYSIATIAKKYYELRAWDEGAPEEEVPSDGPQQPPDQPNRPRGAQSSQGDDSEQGGSKQLRPESSHGETMHLIEGIHDDRSDEPNFPILYCDTSRDLRLSSLREAQQPAKALVEAKPAVEPVVAKPVEDIEFADILKLVPEGRRKGCNSYWKTWVDAKEAHSTGSLQEWIHAKEHKRVDSALKSLQTLIDLLAQWPEIKRTNAAQARWSTLRIDLLRERIGSMKERIRGAQALKGVRIRRQEGEGPGKLAKQIGERSKDVGMMTFQEASRLIPREKVALVRTYWRAYDTVSIKAKDLQEWVNGRQFCYNIKTIKTLQRLLDLFAEQAESEDAEPMAKRVHQSIQVAHYDLCRCAMNRPGTGVLSDHVKLPIHLQSLEKAASSKQPTKQTKQQKER